MLTDLAVKGFKATGKEYQKSDKDGLYLVVRAKGDKFWLGRYRINGKDVKVGFGNYPGLSILDARKLNQVARTLIEAKRDPGDLLKHPIARQMILIDGNTDIRDIDEAIEEAGIFATRQARPTFGQAAAKFKSDWVDKRWKSPDRGWTPVRLHLLPRLPMPR